MTAGTAELSREEIVSSLRRLEPKLRTCGVTKLAIFGSRARGDHHRGSDLDVLVDILPDAGFSLLDLVGVSHVIGDALGIQANIFMRRSLEADMAASIRPDIIGVFR